MKSFPAPDAWANACSANSSSQAKDLLRQKGWNKGAKPPTAPSLVASMTSAWVEVCRTRAHQVALVMPGCGVVPGDSPELREAVDVLLAKLVEQKWSSHTASPEERVWWVLVNHTPHVTQQQRQALMKAGRSEELLILMERGLWQPSAREVLEVMDAMKGEWGERGDVLLLGLLQTNLDALHEAPDGCRLTAIRLLRSFNDSYASFGRNRQKLPAAGQKREGMLVTLCDRFAEAGVALGAEHYLLSLARNHRIELIAAMGRAGTDLPDLPGERKTFFSLLLSTPVQPNDVRLEENPWGRWLRSPKAEVVMEMSNLGSNVLASTWKQWRLEASFPAVAPVRPRVRM